MNIIEVEPMGWNSGCFRSEAAMFSQQIYLQGLGLGAGLIMGIGAQNAHVLRTAVRGRHVLPTVATCIVVDAILIAAGTSGLGALIEASPVLMPLARYGGAAFLVWYGLRCWSSSWRGGATLSGDAAAQAHTASALWFSAIGLGARRFASTLARPAVWRVIEALTGAVMLVLAVLLVVDS